MDPNATLAELRRALAAAADAAIADADDGAYLFRLECAAAAAGNLDEWLSKGGFLPTDWQKGR